MTDTEPYSEDHTMKIPSAATRKQAAAMRAKLTDAILGPHGTAQDMARHLGVAAVLLATLDEPAVEVTEAAGVVTARVTARDGIVLQWQGPTDRWDHLVDAGDTAAAELPRILAALRDRPIACG